MHASARAIKVITHSSHGCSRQKQRNTALILGRTPAGALPKVPCKTGLLLESCPEYRVRQDSCWSPALPGRHILKIPSSCGTSLEATCFMDQSPRSGHIKKEDAEAQWNVQQQVCRLPGHLHVRASCRTRSRSHQGPEHRPRTQDPGYGPGHIRTQNTGPGPRTQDTVQVTSAARHRECETQLTPCVAAPCPAVLRTLTLVAVNDRDSMTVTQSMNVTYSTTLTPSMTVTLNDHDTLNDRCKAQPGRRELHQVSTRREQQLRRQPRKRLKRGTRALLAPRKQRVHAHKRRKHDRRLAQRRVHRRHLGWHARAERPKQRDPGHQRRLDALIQQGCGAVVLRQWLRGACCGREDVEEAGVCVWGGICAYAV
eukprot:365910-Chlamydomonas_euryale.AAC.10